MMSERSQLRIEGKQLVLSKCIKRTRNPQLVQDSCIEKKHEVRSSILVVVTEGELQQCVITPCYLLERFRVEGGRNCAAQN